MILSFPCVFHSFLGWEDLEVVDPNAEGAAKGAAEQDEGHNQAVSFRGCTLPVDHSL